MKKTPFSLFNPDNVQALADKASQLLPNDEARDEMHRSRQLLVQNALSRLELVTREEFDAQTAVLQKTRSKVDALEQQLAELEKQLALK